jgi:HEAT repeat protein
MGPLIVTYTTLFPLLLPLWQQRPLTPEDLMPGPYPVVVAAEQIALQRKALRDADRELRLAILRELREANLEEAHRVILDQVAAEADPGVLACAFQQLAMSPFSLASVESVIRARLADPDDEVRLWATALLGRLGATGREPLEKALATDPQPAVRQQAANGLRDLPGGVGLGLYQTFRQDPDPRLAAGIAVGFCLGPDAAAAGPPRGGAGGGRPPAVRFAVVARLRDLAAPLPEALVPLARRDPSPAVRGEAAAVMAHLARSVDRTLVLELARDPDPEVRRRAVAACRAFPSAETLAALLDRLEDERTLVRREAEEVLVESSPAQPAGPATAERLGRTAFPGRAHQCRVLARIGFAESATAVHAILREEHEPEGLRDAVFALGRFGYREAAAEIAALGTHASPVVREAVGEALGYLAVPATYPVLQALAFAAEEPVRHAAILAMARTGDGSAFGDTVRQVLVQTAPEKMSPANRAAAAWTAARLRPVHPELVRRLKVQATEAVVPGMMGMMMFEQDFVLVSVDFALAALAREEALAKTLFEEVYRLHQVVVVPGQPPPPGTTYTPTKEVLEYSRQAREFLEGRPSEARLRPVASAAFHVDLLQP